jgi:hypothetical protein
MYCKDCKFWQDDSDDGYAPIVKEFEMRTCSNIERFYTGYNCNPKDIGDSGAWIEGDEGWGWMTGGNFGCVHFTVRKE